MENNKTLNIAIEAFPLTDAYLTGIGNTCKHIIEELNKIDKKNNYYIFFKGGNPHIDINNPKWKLFFTTKNQIAIKNAELKETLNINADIITYIKYIIYWVLKKFNNIYIQIIIPILLLLHKIDIYIMMSPVFPPLFFTNKKIKVGAFIYDLVWKYYPHTMDKSYKIKMVALLKYNINKIDFFFAISESTKNNSLKLKEFKNKNIYTIPLGINSSIYKIASNKSIATVKYKYGIDKRYILSIGTIEPRKNLETLLRAFSRINKKYILVLVGKQGWVSKKFFDLFDELNIKDHIIMTGYVPTDDIGPLYSGAEVFVYPSLYEGFGLPVLEAMQCGCPVIAANTSSIPEIAGNAAILIDPTDIESLVRAITTVITKPSLRKKLKQNGFKQAKNFSWQKTAYQFLEIIQKELSS